jgi:ABC-type nitrate/sulfonate/bicarbonate transport system substrate-binding protein
MLLRWFLHRKFHNVAIALLAANLAATIDQAFAQEPKTKIRIANSALSVTSLPLLAAREWKLFHERGLDVEIILMSPAISVPAIVSGEIDYFAGVGPGVASASLSGLPLRAVWVSTGFLDAASLNPPTLFLAQKKGFPSILDIGSLVEMPGGGLTVLIKDIKAKPDELKRVIWSMQSAKDMMRKSKDKTVELMVRVLKMDRDSAAGTYDVFLKTLSVDGVPTRVGMENLVKSIQAQGRFTDKKPAFTDVADDRLAREVAKELGYKVQ